MTHTKEQLAETLRLHALWLRNDSEGSRADLSRADLFRADLSGAILSRANLSGAILSRANLSGADLSGADLFRVNLSGANLSGANLSRANLSGAILSRAILSRANLSGADLSGADLFRVNLSGANLSGANLSGADLSRVNLSGANLSRADLSKDVFNNLSPEQISMFKIVPEVGSFYGFKKMSDGVVVKLFISKKAKRINSFGSRKCRASRVKVVEAFNLDGSKHLGSSFTNPTHNKKLQYKIGSWIEVEDFSDDMTQECAPGIHFFLTFEEAKAW